MGATKRLRKEKEQKEQKSMAMASNTGATAPQPDRPPPRWTYHVVSLFGPEIASIIFFIIRSISSFLLWLFRSFPQDQDDDEHGGNGSSKQPQDEHSNREKVAWQAYREGGHAKALSQLQALLEDVEREHGKDHAYVAALHSKIAKVQLSLGKLFEAWIHANLAHNTYEILKDKDAHALQLAAAKHDIGVVYIAQKKFDKALQNLCSSIEFYKSIETAQNKKEVAAGILKAYSDIAAVNASQDKYTNAISVLRDTIKVYEPALGTHLDVANAKFRLAECIIASEAKQQGVREGEGEGEGQGEDKRATGSSEERDREVLGLYEYVALVYGTTYGRKHRMCVLAIQQALQIRQRLGEDFTPGAAVGEAAGEAKAQGATAAARATGEATAEITAAEENERKMGAKGGEKSKKSKKEKQKES